MSRLNDAIDKIETALGELKASVDHVAKTRATSSPQTAEPAIEASELQAMKAELGEAVRLLESVQTSSTHPSDEASS